MANDHTKKTVRSFQCRDYLYELFEEMSQDLDCSVDYLVNEAMRQYAKSRNYGGRSAGSRASIPPMASASDVEARESLVPESHDVGSTKSKQDDAPTIPPIAEPAPVPGPATTPAITPVGLLDGADLTPPPAVLPPLPASMSPAPRATRTSEPAPSFGLPPMSAALPPLGGGLPAPALPPMSAALPPLGGGLPAPALPPMPPALPPMAAPALPPLPPPPPAGAAALPPMSSPVAARQSLFVIFNGQKMPVTMANNDEFIIGRSSKTADLAIKDGNISRRHAAIVYHGGAFYMKDLGSTNGVDFQGQKVGTKRIDEGDVFTVCEYEVRFTYQ